ncbi:MAG: Na/Pi symporter [Gammaproteobacteria bacterium]|nr:Na/Pi symporter [Gammaproteobacteria bacterium]MDE0251664.1 Na/Pi symporter [Gammaproteobacteria bacterium]MDE0403326.1 Na/Pi symporter [Gammaproteobacteria bacterium]
MQRLKSVFQRVIPWLIMLVSVYVLLVAVGAIGVGFRQLCGGKEGVASLFVFATNPFVGLVLAILATALVQSSSTVTSIIVGLVAAGLPISVAIPMIMGANVGTTVTNTLVSIGHVRRPDEFKNAFAAATIHDFFNLLSILVFLPLELVFGILEKLSGTVTHLIENIETIDASGNGVIKVVVGSGTRLLESLTSFLPEKWAGSVQIVMGIALILLSIMFLGNALKSVFVGKAQRFLEAAIGKGPIMGIGSGALVTVLVQSSSTTTSIIVPLAGSGVINLRQVYPFTLGANIGTTITALLAATAITGPTHAVAHQIAIAHFLYNTLGVIVIYGIPWLRKLPMVCAEWLARIGSERKIWAVAYVIGLFFGVPCALVALSTWLS